MMDSAFYIVSGILALGLFALIARNLWRLDRRERDLTTAAKPPEAPEAVEAPDASLRGGAIGDLPPLPMDEDGDSERRIAPPGSLDDFLRAPARPPAQPRPAAPQPAPREAERAAPVPSPAGEPVRFTTYYPKEVAPQVWHSLAAYLYKPSAADAVAADAKQQLGDKIAGYREIADAGQQPVAEGALVKAEPYLDGFQFNPPSVTVGFFEDWHRFDFKLRANGAPLNAAANGGIVFTVEGLLVGELPLSVYVGQREGDAEVANVMRAAYAAVFASYSRKDTHIVQRVERAYKALGMETLRDMLSLRSGEEWNDALKTLIDRADVFQLFWSSNAAPSDHVRMEWEYALTRAGTRDKFIRPVYWEETMPPVPDELKHLHFAYQPDLDD